MDRDDRSSLAETPDEDPRENDLEDDTRDSPYARDCDHCEEPAVERGEDGELYCEGHDPDRHREGEVRDDVPTREIADDWLWEQYGFGLTRVEEELADRAMTESPWEDCTTEHVAAISPNEVTAGVHVRRVDVDDRVDDMPFMVELEQYFPPEDDRAGDVVALHGEHAVLQLIAALAQVTSSRFDEVPWDVE